MSGRERARERARASPTSCFQWSALPSVGNAGNGKVEPQQIVVSRPPPALPAAHFTHSKPTLKISIVHKGLLLLAICPSKVGVCADLEPLVGRSAFFEKYEGAAAR